MIYPKVLKTILEKLSSVIGHANIMERNMFSINKTACIYKSGDQKRVLKTF